MHALLVGKSLNLRYIVRGHILHMYIYNVCMRENIVRGHNIQCKCPHFLAIQCYGDDLLYMYVGEPEPQIWTYSTFYTCTVYV